MPEPASPKGIFDVADLPEPPPYSLRNAITVIGPGAILAGLSIGSGEWLLGPAVTVKYGLGILWIATASLLLQLFLNMECVRYTLATGEPLFMGVMRLRPSGYWVWFWAVTTFLQIGWAGWAGTGAGALAALYLGALPGPHDSTLVAWIGIGIFLGAVILVSFGRTIEHAIEFLHWIMAVVIIVSLAILAFFLIPTTRWSALLWGFLGFGEHGFEPFPSAPDFFLLSAFAAYSGAGGTINATLSYWVRDKGFGMGGYTGYQLVPIGRKEIVVSHPGITFPSGEESTRKWQGWWKFVASDQYLFWLAGAFITMAFPALLSSAFLPPGSEIRGPAIAAELAQGLSAVNGLFWGLTLVASAWILVTTQIGIIDGFSQIITDLLWSGSRAVRALGSVRSAYWAVLGLITVAGLLLLAAPLFGLGLEPIVLIQLSANWAGVNLVMLAVQTIVVNRKLLPAALKPPLWREIMVGLCALFFLGLTSAWLLFSREAKTFAPYAVSFFLVALLVAVGLGNLAERHKRLARDTVSCQPPAGA